MQSIIALCIRSHSFYIKPSSVNHFLRKRSNTNYFPTFLMASQRGGGGVTLFTIIYAVNTMGSTLDNRYIEESIVKIKFIGLLALILLVALFGCEDASIVGDLEGAGLTPEDLAPTGAMAYPQSETETLALVTGALEALAGDLQANAAASSYASKATYSESMPLNWSGQVGDGTVDITGSITSSSTYPDEGFYAEINTTYNDFMEGTYRMYFAGTIDSVSFTGISYSYEMSGEVSSDARVSMSVDLVTGTDLVYLSDGSMTMDYTLSVAEAHTLSILREDGLGAKIVMSYSTQGSITDIDMTNWESSELDALTAWMETRTANVRVYNDDNELIGEYNVPLTELVDITEMI